MREWFVALGKSQESVRKVFATHLYRTHRTIELQNVVNVVLQVAVMLQQIGYGSIQIAATHLRTRHFLGVVDVGIAGESAYKLNEEFFRVVDMRQNNVGSDQGTGIDERIARLAVLVFQLYKRIESRARRLLTYSCP